MRYSMETMREVWDDQHGGCIEVGPDRDAIGLVEMRYKNSEGKIEKRIAIAPEQALLVARAMIACADEIKRDE